MCPDHHDFDELYHGLPLGLVIAACPSIKSFDTLQSFCDSLKAAAIRDGSTAMNFWWAYARKNWKNRGIEHLRSFIGKYSNQGVRLFLIKNPNRSIDPDIAGFIQQAALEASVTIVVTTLADAEPEQPPDDKSLVSLIRKDLHFHPSAASILLQKDRATDDGIPQPSPSEQRQGVTGH